MRFFFVLIWLMAAVAPSASPRPPAAPLHALHYVDLRAWAASRKFDFNWPKKDDPILLTNRWARLSFGIDSRRVEINGIAVWLSFNLFLKNGSAHIAQKDLESVVEPVLYPTKNKKRPIKVIAISAGHGGKDPGFQNGTHQEKKYTLRLAEDLETVLKRAGFKVVQIRRTDQYIRPEDQPVIAKTKGADTFICLHYNSSLSDTNSVKGVEVFCMTPPGAISTNGGEQTPESFAGNEWDRSNMLLAYETQKAIVRNFGMTDRGVRHARFIVLRDIRMPAILIEGGFLSNPDDANKIFDARHRLEMAHAIADGLLAYKKIVQR
jgi:N-acetylmuramoyl-L-alanine amidase